MKILLASSSPFISNHFFSTNEIFIDVVETGQEIFKLLGNTAYDCMIVDVSLRGIDIWSFVRFVNNNISSSTKKRLPIFLINESNLKYPTLLTSNYDIRTLDISHPVNVDNLLNDNPIDKPKILIIEDNTSIANGMKIMLEKDYEVDLCYTGEEGLIFWKKKKHDLILLDLMMPGIQGDDVLMKIRTIHPDQLIMIVSARSERELQQQLILLGANDYLVKPFTPEQLNKACRIVLTQTIHQQENVVHEKKLGSISNQLWLILNALENNEVETAIEMVNTIMYSLPDNVEDEFQLKIKSV